MGDFTIKNGEQNITVEVSDDNARLFVNNHVVSDFNFTKESLDDFILKLSEARKSM